MKTSKSLQTEFSVVAYLAVGKLLKRIRLRIRKPVMNIEYGQDLEPLFVYVWFLQTITTITNRLTMQRPTTEIKGGLVSDYRWDTRWQCAYKRNLEARSCNHSCCRKAIRIIYYECFWHEVASMQFAFPILSSVACPRLQYFSTVSHNGTIFGGDWK